MSDKRESGDHKDVLTAALGMLLFIILPLLAPKGYYQLGEYKSVAFLCTGAAIIIASAFCALTGKEIKCFINPGNAAGWFLFYGLSLCLSTVFSVDRRTAFWGAAGWRIGFVAELVSVICCISFIHYFHWDKLLQSLFLSGGAVVIAIAILNRFQVYPFSFMRDGEGYFLSTIGQINWYCGWLSVILPFAAGLLFAEERKLQKIALSMFCFIAFFSAITQGSDSAFLFIGVLFMTLFLYAAGSREKIHRALSVWVLFLAACVIAAVILEREPGIFAEYFLNHAGMALRILRWKGIYILFIVSFAGMVYTGLPDWQGGIRRTEMKKSVRGEIFIRNLIPVGMVLVSVFLLAVQVLFPEIFTPEFGNNRGIQWKAVSDTWRSFSPGRKLIGAGPDCLNYYLRNYTEYAAQIHAFFGENIVAAHSILLHRLFTTGILGTAAYILLLASSVRKLLTRETTMPFALVVLCYCANGLVSFDQVMNMPYVFLLMGAGLGLLTGEGIIGTEHASVKKACIEF
ncbi:MAG: hypothetical protein IJV14_08165 [Lachnospiraceae bacterium]|nr:hypothetical protein [Lachnospiraceae bacterium]